jgi:ribosomal protein S3
MTADEIKKVNQLYKDLDSKDARITILEQTNKALEAQVVALSLAVKIEETISKLDKINKK